MRREEMATGDIPEREANERELGSASQDGKFLLVFLLLGALFVGVLYAIHRTNATRNALEAQQAETQKQLVTEFQSQLSTRLSAMANASAQQMDELKEELDTAAKRMGATGGELKRARKMVAQLQSEQRQQAQELQQELAQKADQQQLGALNQDVSSQRTDLDNTKKDLDAVRTDLGMARSEMGNLIARNHDDIEQLRRLGDRDYFEFTADRKIPKRVAGIGLTVAKTNVKRHQFNMNLLVDDVNVEKKDRTINEPIIFYVGGSKKPYELVVNEVKPNEVKGYISTPKGANEVATRQERAH
jgi:vacuolar-type H+-ATPase subunit I/STV1